MPVASFLGGFPGKGYASVTERAFDAIVAPATSLEKESERMAHAKILIVEENESCAADLKETLKNLGYTVCAAVSCGHQAVELASDARPDLALVDLGLEGKSPGLETAGQLGSRFDVPVVYLTDGTEEDLLQRAQATRPFGFRKGP
ncbi:MAG: response regulator [Gemmatimonadetes bacterium]|nr:response regulator [Gemmatimonadota bacterium]